MLTLKDSIVFQLAESKDEKYPFAFRVTCRVDAKDGTKHIPLKTVLEEYKAQGDLVNVAKLLASIDRVAAKSNFISELKEREELFRVQKFSEEYAYLFLMEIPIYEECGIICISPDFWQKKYKTSLKVSIKEPAKLGLKEIMSFSPEIYLDEEKLSSDEIKKVLSEKKDLIFLKGKWVVLDREKWKNLIDTYNRIKNTEFTLLDALRLDAKINSEPGVDIEISHEKWYCDLKEKMLNPAKAENIPDTFNANLRPYQKAGFNWLSFMQQHGFGALLADDMGLGKTIQVLALLDLLRTKQVKTLLIIPASLIANWKWEAHERAPKIKVKVLHGKETYFNTENADLFITTYGMALKLEKLKKIDWDLLILDEAQAIKNSSSERTRVIKQISAKSRIAMTGTPIENGLSDLWSIFDFLNKGMLFSQKRFLEFARNLNKESQGYEKLKNMVRPFILRRLKTDKKIISDLPEKKENKRFVTLSSRQVVLYKECVNDLAVKLANGKMDNFQRGSLVLQSITKLKQICNHPAQYLHNGDFVPKYSGKFEMLAEICETILENKERVLVFTQYKEMAQPLSDFLEKIFKKRGLVLHGGTGIKSRGALVEELNCDKEYMPYMVITFGVGGTGLNLTAANHVIHFDRWWNPAVESQASDRAFRIGQKKDVNVYTFIASGTLEDKIDGILEGKKNLADKIITESSGGKMLTEMSNSELLTLLKLEEA